MDSLSFQTGCQLNQLNLANNSHLNQNESAKSRGLSGNVGYVRAKVAWVCRCVDHMGQVFT